MTALPPKAELDGSSSGHNQGVFKAAIGGMRDFLAGLLGSDGTQASALAALKVMDPQAVYNLKPVFSVGSNALTCTLKDRAGNDLSSTNPGFIAQRSATASDGGFNLRTLTANVALTISSGSTLGHTSGNSAPLYWYLLDNAGAQVLAVSGTFKGYSGLFSTTAEGGGGGADSGTLLYATAAHSDLPGRLIAITADTQTTAGTWAAVPSATQVAPFPAEGATFGPKTMSPVAGLINGIIQCSRNANAETISIKTLAGADPSPSDPVYVVFRNATAGTGDYAVLPITAATSLVLSSGSTLGASNGAIFRVWLVGFNDGGTFRLGAVNCLSGTTVLQLRDDHFYSATAEGGAGAADSAQTIYAGAGVTSKPISVLGYLEYTLATAGTWNTAPSKIQLRSAGMALPGEVVTEQYTQTSTQASTTSTSDQTSISATINVKSAANLIEATAQSSVATVSTANAAGNSAQFKIKRSSTVIASGRAFTQGNGAAATTWGAGAGLSLRGREKASAAGSVTYDLTYRDEGSGTAYIHYGNNTGSIKVQEIQA